MVCPISLLEAKWEVLPHPAAAAATTTTIPAAAATAASHSVTFTTGGEALLPLVPFLGKLALILGEISPQKAVKSVPGELLLPEAVASPCLVAGLAGP